jgi:polar amino acid transport system substrate-binding protein
VAGVGTLDRIIKDKKIRVTAEVTSPPFGILDRSNQPDGSEIATARQLAKDLGVELELVQVTAPQRIPALLAGRADVAISSLSITFDRAKTVMFAPPHGALSIVIAGAKRVNIKSASDMAGKKIGLTRATLEEATVPGIAPSSAQIVFFDDIAATLQAMISGQVDAAGMSAFAAKSVADRNPKAEIENKFTYARRTTGGGSPRRFRSAAVPAHVGVPQQAQRRAREHLPEIHRGSAR